MKNGVIFKSFKFGKTGDIPLIGDWNNDGTSDAGVFRPSTTYWYFDTTKTGSINTTFRFGAMGDLPKSLSLPTVAPVALFTSDIRNGTAPLTVSFTGQSTGTAPLTYAWDFTNDGQDDSELSNPVFTFATPGTFTVKLTVRNRAGSDSEIKNGYIVVNPAPVAPTADFTTDERYGYAPMTVRFTNQSTGTAPLTYAWDFTNDGKIDSELSNPEFTYSSPGSYTVKLTVTNSLGSDSVIRYDYISVYEIPVAPSANFFANKRSGNAPLEVRFTDSSTGSSPFTYAWDFGDGATSVNQNPTHIYPETGLYTVTLTVTNNLGSDQERKTGFINVTENQPGGSHAGIALTFDDNSIDQWYSIRDMLQQYNAHVTFFVTGFGNLDPYQIEQLRTLQADGNEIGFHGTHHIDAAPYLLNHTVQEYIDYEITPDLTLMRNSGFNAVDFAYPGGSDAPAATHALEAQFGHIRDTYYAWDDSVYYPYGSNQPFIWGIGIDDSTYGNSMNDIYEGLERAKQDDTILITYAHVPVRNVSGYYMISYERLENILRYVSDNNMKFYTVSELT
jgi:PKD repeat protein